MSANVKVQAQKNIDTGSYGEKGFVFDVSFSSWVAESAPYTWRSGETINLGIQNINNKTTVLQLLSKRGANDIILTAAEKAAGGFTIYVATNRAIKPNAITLRFVCYPIAGDNLNVLSDYTTYVCVVNPLFNISGASGTSDHTQLINRDSADQHPISAITGLQSALDSKAADSDLTAEIARAEAAENRKVSKSGDQMTGVLSLGGQNGGLAFLNPYVAIDGHSSGTAFHNMATPTAAADGANKGYVDGRTPDFATSEVATNRKWTDGKTIYQRTISGSISATTSMTTFTLLAQTDIDRFINSYGSIGRRISTNKDQWAIPLYPLAASRQVGLVVNEQGFKMLCKWDFSTTLYYDVTFEYTKNE